MDNTKEILDIFQRLSDFLKNKAPNVKADHLSLKDKEVLMVGLRNAEGEKSLKVVPLIAGNTMDSVAEGLKAGDFARMTEPKGKSNAVAAIVIGRDMDSFTKYIKGSTSKRNVGGSYTDDKEGRIENAKNVLVPAFEALANEFLEKEKVEGKNLKLEVVNGKWSQVDAVPGEYSRTKYINHNSVAFPGKEEPYFYVYAMPLALRISFVK